jgi:hypothetical protein
MKTFRLIMALVLVCGLLLGLPFTAQAKDSDLLTLDRVIQISDSELILEFSKPVVLNKFQSNRGPYGALRFVNSSNAVGYAYNKYDVKGDALQWAGTYSYIGDDHSKLLWTINMTRFGCGTITQIMNMKNEDALRGIEKDKLKLRFVLEEVPFNENAITADGKIDNVTTEDGKQYLTPTYPKGWESCAMDFEVNFNYPINRDEVVGVSSASQNWDFDIMWKGEGIVVEETDAPEVEIVRVLKNDPKTIALIFAADLLAVAVLVIVLVIKKKKGKAA